MHDVAPVYDIIFADGLGVVSFGAAPAQAKPRFSACKRAGRRGPNGEKKDGGDSHRHHPLGRADGRIHRASRVLRLRPASEQ